MTKLTLTLFDKFRVFKDDKLVNRLSELLVITDGWLTGGLLRIFKRFKTLFKTF